ncbi:MAG: hypothetical protein KC444_04020 [Nitrosopumilus sp.]|nr:hypothetical protein [Nitrosopumilus sp.]
MVLRSRTRIFLIGIIDKIVKSTAWEWRSKSVRQCKNDSQTIQRGLLIYIDQNNADHPPK